MLPFRTRRPRHAIQLHQGLIIPAISLSTSKRIINQILRKARGQKPRLQPLI